MELMQIQHLSKVYGQGENQVRAVDDISFTVEKGEFLAIIGPSGSGKSTLLHILGGVDCPTSGKVFVDGQDVYAQNEDQLAIFRRRQVGLIYQFYNLIPVLNVVENMTLPVLMDGRQVNQERLEELLDVLGLVLPVALMGLGVVLFARGMGLALGVFGAWLALLQPGMTCQGAQHDVKYSYYQM